MMKLVATVVAGLAFASPAFAQEMTCDEASMTKVQQAVDAVADAAKKDAAKADLTMAMDAMKANKADECVAALKNASDAAMAQ
jgi:hypothetical protein